MASLHDPRTLLTSLVSSIPTSSTTPSSTSNPLKDLPPTAKQVLLTLHVLYPNEFLPALDLLDRHLLTRFISPTDPHPTSPVPIQQDTTTLSSSPSPSPTKADHAVPAPATAPTTPNPRGTAIYYVRSAQQPRSNFSNSTSARHYDPLSTHYEVRPLAWNCSCPAFAFAAFPATLGSEYSSDGDGDTQATMGEAQDWRFGGVSRGAGAAPVCKHLLACVLVERCEVFRACVEEREVSVEELAAWAAGWGG